MNLLQETLVSVFWTLRAHGSEITIGELLDGLRLADEIETEMQFKSLKNNLKLLWSANTDPRVESEFESVWEFQVEARIQSLLASLIETSPLQHDAVISQQLEPVPVSTSVEILQVPQNAQLDVPGILTDEVSSEIKPPPNLTTSDPTISDNGSNDTVTEEPHRPNYNEKRSQPGRQSYSARRFHGHRFKLKIATDNPELLRTVGVVPVGISPNLKFGQPEAIFAYAPISRLSMTYVWRYLRRPVPDGPANVLDIDATIAQVAHQGFFLTPAYRRRQSNHAHLMFLIDQDGSMGPFRSISQNLVDTAREETSIKQVDVHYFHNVFHDVLYKDDHLVDWIEIDKALENCTPNTSILVVSDAGAARGHRSDERCEASLKMIIRLQQITNLVAWLNPMPRERWSGSSAEILANEIQMFQLDNDGFSSAVDVLQGRGVVS